jgi:hypothetical protein
VISQGQLLRDVQIPSDKWVQSAGFHCQSAHSLWSLDELSGSRRNRKTEALNSGASAMVGWQGYG